MLEASTLILATYNADPPLFTRKSVNKEYCRFFEVTPEQVVGRSCLESTPKTHKEKVGQKLHYCMETDSVMVSVEPVVRPNGSNAVIRWVDVPVKDRRGEIVELIAIGSPMEDRRIKRDRRRAE